MKKWMGLGMSALLLIAALTGCGTTQQETASNEISRKFFWHKGPLIIP